VWLTFTPVHHARRADRHRRALGAGSGGGRVADPEGADGPAAAEEIREDRAGEPQPEGDEDKGNDCDDIEAGEVEEAAKTRPDDRPAAV
jgi:hypothetical protein